MLNIARLNELKSEVGEEDFSEVIEIFCEEVEEVLKGLQTGDPSELAQQLHFLKGSALNIGLQKVGELCESEEICLRSDAKHAADVAGLRMAYDDSIKELANLIG